MMNVAIVGAGVTGLTAGYNLAKKGHIVTVYEKEPVLGGLASTIDIHGVQLEQTYHHIFTNDTEIFDLIGELRLENQLHWFMPRNAIYKNSTIYPFTTPLDLLRYKELTLSQRVALGLMVYKAKFVRHWERLEDMTAKDWIVRLAGAKVYEMVWEPLLISKFDQDASRISAAWIWNKLKLRGSTREKNLNRELLGYMRGSFGLIQQRLADEIVRRGGAIKLSQPVRHLEPEDNGSICVQTDMGTFLYDKAIVTTAPRIFTDMIPGLPDPYRTLLSTIKYKANICLLLEMTGRLSGYYWTTIADKNIPFVAIVEHTNLIPVEDYDGTHLVYLSRYLDARHPLVQASDEEITDLFLNHLQKMFPSWTQSGIQQVRITKSQYAQPVIETGYSRITPSFRTPFENLFLADMAQIYPEDRGQNYAVRLGKQIADLF